jgi:hypothetical protein
MKIVNPTSLVPDRYVCPLYFGRCLLYSPLYFWLVVTLPKFEARDSGFFIELPSRKRREKLLP